MARSSVNGSARRGTLRIGDQWNAINIIARSQTHPLKAVCELVENAIDAKAQQIDITRRRVQRQVYLEIADNGQGIAPNAEGEPDFARIATHVCDSMKRHLAVADRQNVHGEFGIGLLSFWSLGESLRMISGSPDGRLLEMELRAGRKNYLVRPVRSRLALGGTRVIVGPLSEAARKLVTGEKLVRYLAAELRDRIRATGVTIQVIDRLVHRSLVVRPQEFLGERLACDDYVDTPYGRLRVELYLREGSGEAPAAVAVCKDGTRVLRSLTELEALQHPPWTEELLEGVLDYPAFELAPGTRCGIVPDDRLSAFISGVEQLEGVVTQLLAARQQARAEKANEQILRQLKKAFTWALRDLPASEYLFFDLPGSRDNAETNGDKQQQRDGEAKPGLPLTEAVRPDDSRTDRPEPAEQDLLPFAPGLLSSVAILPRHPRARPGQQCRLRAVALDEHGQPASGEIVFRWRMFEGNGTIEPAVDVCHVSSSSAGIVAVEAEASDGSRSATAQALVKFIDSHLETDADSPKGLPAYRIAAEHGRPWRSRYDEKKNEIVINSAHRDFAASRSTLAKHRRYIGKLYAKEVVLINFPHESPATVMERLIELTLRTEENL